MPPHHLRQSGGSPERSRCVRTPPPPIVSARLQVEKTSPARHSDFACKPHSSGGEGVVADVDGVIYSAEVGNRSVKRYHRYIDP